MTAISGNRLPCRTLNTSPNQETSTKSFSKFFKFLALLPFTAVAGATSLSDENREVSLIGHSHLSENTADVAFSTFHGVENSSNPKEASLFAPNLCHLSEDTAELGMSIIHDAQNISGSSESRESTFNRWSEKGFVSKEASSMLAITGLAFLIYDNRIKTAKLKAAIKKLTESNNMIEEQRDNIKDKEELNINYRSMISNLTDGLRDLKTKLKESNKKVKELENLIKEIEKLNKDQEIDKLYSEALINLHLSNIDQLLDDIESGATRLEFNTESPLFPPSSSEN